MAYGLIYVIRFRHRIGSLHPRGAARHYLGYCAGERLAVRLEEHRTGRGAVLTSVAAAKGIGFELVAVLRGSRTFERKLKNLGNTPRLLARLERGTSKYNDLLLWGEWMDKPCKYVKSGRAAAAKAVQ